MKKYFWLTAALLFFISLCANDARSQNETIIHACYHSKKGDLRKVSGPGQCRKDETETQWNVAGAKGETGERGGKGDRGDAGSVDPSVVQLRISGSCSAGKFITAIAQDGSVTCGAAPSSSYAGFAEMNPSAEAASQRTILDVPGVNLRLACVPSAKTKIARLILTTTGYPIDYVFESGTIAAGTATEGSPLTLQALAGDGTRRFFAQLVQVDGSPSVTLHGSVVNFTHGTDSVCLFQWSITTTE